MTARKRCRLLANLEAGDATALAILAVTTLFIFSSAMSGWFIHTHENVYNYMRVFEYRAEMVAGNFPPLLMNDAINGAGYAFPVFYPSLSYVVGACLYSFLGHLAWATNLTFLIAPLLSSFAAYFLFRNLSGSARVALFCAALYVAAPYRLSQVFVRGAMAETWSMVWLPLMFNGLWWLVSRRRFRWWFPVAIAAGFWSHSVVTVYYIGCLLFFALGTTPRLGIRGWLLFVYTVVAGLGVVAFFLIPQLALMPTVRVSIPGYMMNTREFVEEQRIYFWQFFSARNDAWFEFSKPGDADGMSYAIGVASMLIPLIVFCPLCRLWKTGLGGISRRLRIVLWFGIVSLVAWVLLLVFMVKPLLFLAWLPSPMAYLQFTFRLLGLANFLACCIIACFLPQVRMFRRFYGVFPFLAMATVLTIPGWMREVQLRRELTEEIMNADFMREYHSDIGYTLISEYLPRSFPMGLPQEEFLRKPFLSGDGNLVIDWEDTPSRKLLLVEATSATTARLPVVAYPFWDVTMDSNAITPVDSAGYWSVAVPPGEHRFEFRRRRPRIFAVGATVSVLALALCLLVSWWTRRGGWLSIRRRGRRAVPVPSS